MITNMFRARVERSAKGIKVWIVKRCDTDPDLVGKPITCGVPDPLAYPIGSIQMIIRKTPRANQPVDADPCLPCIGFGYLCEDCEL